RDAFLSSIMRCLKPGGVMVLTYVFAGVFNDAESGRAFVEASDEVLAAAGFELGRRWQFGREWATPLVFEYRRPL
ncbi:MAG: hypothetical protein KDB18_11385, partial [Salinibacterium sp.]|nr:hypothetical protein [Salinibacterium sp.]